MIRQIGALAALLMLACGLAAPACAEYVPRDCEAQFKNAQTDKQIDTAMAAMDKCLRDFMGVVPIEKRAAAGESVVRAFVGRGERQLPLFVEYVRPRAGGAGLGVRTIEESKPAYVAPVADASFAAVQTRWSRQAKLSAEAKARHDLEERARQNAEHLETVCLPRWSAVVETVRAGRANRVELDSCRPWEFEFVSFLLAQAAKDAGACASGDPAISDDERLMECLLLTPKTAQPAQQFLWGFSAQHLTPENSLLAGGDSLADADYHRLLVWAFDKAFDEDVAVRAVVTPSFTPEYAVGLRASPARGQAAQYSVFYMRPKIQYWLYAEFGTAANLRVKIVEGDAINKRFGGQGSKPPNDPKTIPIDRCERTIDTPLAARIEAVWVEVLGETRYNRAGEPDGFIPTDGTTYHFSARGGFPSLAGHTVATGAETTKPGMLIKLADTLVGFCDGKATAADLDVLTGALERKLAPAQAISR